MLAVALTAAVAPSVHGATASDDSAAKRHALTAAGNGGQAFGAFSSHIRSHGVADALRRNLPARALSSTPDATGDATPEVRLVVMAKSGATSLADVVAAARGAGGRVAERIPQLHAFSLTVPAAKAATLTRVLAMRPDVQQVTQAHRRSFTMIPNDSHWSAEQTYLSAVHAPTAWDHTHGSASVRIAVVDSGVSVGHPDLAGKVAGTYNAVDGSTSVTDTLGHGTGVASVAAAATNNGQGIAGAGWDSSLLAVKVADASNTIWSDAVANGVTWAADHGAKVINLSLGSPQSDPVEADAVAYAESKGALVVAAAGNDATTAPLYPAADPGVLSVGATTTSGTARASFSTYGSWVDVAAPGVSIALAQPGGAYATGDGTSFASPLVAGEAALLRAADPGAGPDRIAAAITGTATGPTLGFGHGLTSFAAALNDLAPATVPTLTAPAAGDTVSGDVPVTVQTSAPLVRVSIPGTAVSRFLTPTGGVAGADLETYGVSGPHTIAAADCSSAALCATQSASIPVTINNPAPTLTGPADGATVGVAFTATADAPGGAVRFQVDGANAGVDTTAPYQLTVSTDALADGPHSVTAVQCNRAGSTCDTANPSAASTVTVRRLHPSITSIAPAPFSPNGDGRRDTTTVNYRLDVAQQASVAVKNSAGATIYGPRSLGSGLAAGSHSWVWNGKNGSGYPVNTGTYTVVLTTSSTVAGMTLDGHAQRTVRVDRTRPAVTGVYDAPGTVYPYRDGFQDTTRLHLHLSEGVSTLQAQIFRGTGSLVRTIGVGARPTGSTYATWNGRTASGAMLPAGTYYYRFVAQDPAGNRTTTAKYAVGLSVKRLLKKTGVKTVSPYGSARATYVRACSALFHSVHGWGTSAVGYYSDYQGCVDGDDVAAVDHAYTLPAAVRYGAVRVDAYGGQAVPGYGDTAALIYYNSAGELSNSDKILGASVATYYGPTVTASSVLNGRTVKWLVGTVDGAWYDVKWYRVVWTYYVLQ